MYQAVLPFCRRNHVRVHVSYISLQNFRKPLLYPCNTRPQDDSSCYIKTAALIAPPQERRHLLKAQNFERFCGLAARQGLFKTGGEIGSIPSHVRVRPSKPVLLSHLSTQQQMRPLSSHQWWPQDSLFGRKGSTTSPCPNEGLRMIEVEV